MAQSPQGNTMNNANEGRSQQRVPIVLAIVLVLVVAAFSIYYYQSQTAIERLQAKGTFSRTVTLLPRTNVTLLPCTPPGCNSRNIWRWDFPYNMSLQSPGYLNVTVYYSNNTLGFMVATWSYNNSKVSGGQQWDFATGNYPRTTPVSMIVPFIKGMIDLVISISPQSTLTARQTISISYYY